ncbi:MAG: penicillin acylase family protein [Candidatus Hodarchaeota archaeon]
MEEILQIAKNAFPPTEGSESLEGIKEEVEILWDKWGIPHIYAKSLEDAYCAQGYIHARHRLWQMELFRRLTTGEISELTGNVTLDMDKHYKIIGLHRIARNCVERLLKEPDNEQLQLLQSYITGVNAGIEKARINPPIEFSVLEIKPREWKLEDSFKIVSLIEWGLSGNYPLELLREHLVMKLGPEMADKIIPLYSGAKLENPIGSNGWVIGPNKSVSGSVLFANDPHLPLTVPAIWILIHLNCPDLNVFGSSFPGLPGVVLGHNKRIAWGCTNVSADNVDLFKLELNPENENQYLYNEQWIDFEIIEEPITIREEPNPIPFKVLMTKFGPVVEYFEIDNKIYRIKLPGKYALRWSSFGAKLEDNLEGFLKINKALNWDEFRDGTKLMTITPQNFLYGDIDGNIGHQHGGKIPTRKYGNGAMVTPGTDEKYNWCGLVPFEKMFSVFNPDYSFVYTANYNEDKAPNGALISQDSIGFYRQKRLKNLLQSKEKFSIEDIKNFQNDQFSEEAAELLPIMLKKVKSKAISKIIPEIISILEKWDYKLTSKSVAGTIYKVWHLETIKAILNPYIDKEFLDASLSGCPYELDRLFKIYDDKPEGLEEILVNTLEKTINSLSEKISSDYNKWEWGNFHKLTLVHPFSLADDAAKALNIGPFKIGGDLNTLNNGYYDPLSDFAMTVGPSYRQIHDLSDWDKSIGIIPGGQSGLPFHKHYKDLMKSYVRGKYIPFLFSRDAISKNLEGVFKFLPK